MNIAAFRIGMTCVAAASLMSIAHAQTGVSFKGQTISMTLGSDPGSAGDTYNRLIAKYIVKYLPGQPTAVVRNMPGADGLVHLNWIYNIAPKDGTTIGLTRQDIPFEPLFSGKETMATYDAKQINWLGSPNGFPAVAISWHTSKVKTAEDLLNMELLIGGIGNTSGSTNEAYVLRNIIGFKFKAVLGYPGPTAVDLAMERGEIEGRASAGWTGLRTRHQDWLRDKKVNILYQMGVEKFPEIPSEVRSVLEFARNDEDRALLKLKYASNNLGFPYLLPPGVKPEVVAVVRAAFEQALADPQLREEAAKQNLDINPISAQKIVDIINESYAASPALLKRLNEASQPPKN